MGRVDGKVAFITGAARGQGRSHAVRLAEEGADIIAVDICGPVPNLQYPAATPENMEQTVQEVKKVGGRIVSRQADVRDRDALKEAIDAGISEFGTLDTVVANAGIVIIKEWDEVTPEIFRDVIDINLVGAWNTVQLAAPHLVENGGGSIILTSSAAGLKGLPFVSAYAASKHGVVGLMRTYATELARHSIRVNSLHPTGVNTPMGASPDGSSPMEPMIAKNPGVAGMLANQLPIQVTEPIDQSNAVLFLASDESRYVTSLTMTVDAGNTQY